MEQKDAKVKPIYLDHAATTPVRDEVREAMEPFLGARFGNPSSAHRWGRSARHALEEARASAASTLGSSPGEIYFVRGGTESLNLAILGWVQAALRSTGAASLAVSALEHRATLECADAAARLGASVHRLGVLRDGRLDPTTLTRCLDESPCLISVMWVNNETGMVLPVDELGALARDRGLFFHTDAVQAVGHLRVRLDETPVDLASIAGHKICGPKSAGILYARREVQLNPLLFGAGQEGGLRPGTSDVASAVGMAKALSLAAEELEFEARRQAGLRDVLERRLRQELPDLIVLGENAPRACHILAVALPDHDGTALVAGLDMAGVAASAGSACHSGTRRTSHVLEALVGDSARGMGMVRFSVGRTTTEAEVHRAAGLLISLVRNRVSDG